MTDRTDFELDQDLVRRLRSISAPPAVPVPDSIYRRAVEVASRRRLGRRLGGLANPFAGHPWRTIGSLAATSVAIVVAVSLAGRWLPANPETASSQSPTSSPTPSPTQSPVPVPTPGVSPKPDWTTPGLGANWSSLSWSPASVGASSVGAPGGVGQVISWRGGFAATSSTVSGGQYSPADSVWISPTGEGWTKVAGLPGAVYVAAAPVGLIAIAVDAGGSASTWTTADGSTWQNAGVADLSGSIVSVAGTDSAIVATTFTVGSPTGCGYHVEYSTDGVHWGEETMEPGLACLGPDDVPRTHVQANAGRLYLVGSAYPEPIPSGMTGTRAVTSQLWFSDDGRNWTHSDSNFAGTADYLEFGRDAIVILSVDSLARSTDGGLTWTIEQAYPPLGTVPSTYDGDGVIVSNGTYFLAVKNGGAKAWISYDATVWTPIEWTAGAPGGASYGGFGIVLMPRGVLFDSQYGAGE